MKKIYSILLAACSMVGISSCDSLDLVPESTISDSGYWQTNDQFNAFHTGIASCFRQYSWYYFAFGETRANIYGDTPFGGEATQGMEVLYNNTLTPTTAGIGNYGGLYYPINQINLMIAKAEENTSLSEADKSYYLGEAYGLRAYLYFHLLRSYGDAIVYTDYTSGNTLDLSNLARKQDPAAQVLVQIKSDITASETAFNGNYAFTKGKNYWSLGATKMLKGEVYLWSGKQMGGGASDYATAKTALQEVDNCPGIALQDAYGDVFKFSNKKNSEIIFAIYNGEGETGLLNGSWNGNFMPQQAYMNNGSRYNEDGEENSTTADAQINGLIRMPLKRAIYQKLYRDEDSRKRVNLRAVYNKDDDGALVYEAAYPYKYQGTMMAGDSKRSMYDDYPVYRYADCLLMLAEAKALLGEDIAEEINAVRKRAYGENYSEAVAYPNDKGDFYAGNEFAAGDEDPIEAVLKERLRELIFEGKRWYDIRLMDKAEKYSLATSNKLLWPIDESTKTNNSLLEQTPGY